GGGGWGGGGCRGRGGGGGGAVGGGGGGGGWRARGVVSAASPPPGSAHADLGGHAVRPDRAHVLARTGHGERHAPALDGDDVDARVDLAAVREHLEHETVEVVVVGPVLACPAGQDGALAHVDRQRVEAVLLAHPAPPGDLLAREQLRP